MHLNVQPRFVVDLLSTALAFMFLLFYGVDPDVMRLQGSGWEKPREIAAAEAYTPAKEQH